MTTATKRPRKRAKQTRIPGTEEDRIKEIDDAMEAYVEARDERMGLTEIEVAAKEKLTEVMQKHKLSIYKGDGFTVTLNEKTKTDVKVQTVDDSESEEEESEE